MAQSPLDQSIDSVSQGPILLFNRSICKSYFITGFPKWNQDKPVISPGNALSPVAGNNSKWSVHGNILYDFNYRSYIDTPFSIYGLQQHYVQSNVRVLYGGTIPIDVIVRSRKSNHPFLRNYTDVNVFFNGNTFKEIARQKILQHVQHEYGKQALEAYRQKFLDKSNWVFDTEQWLKDEQRWSRYLEYKEKLEQQRFAVPEFGSSIPSISVDKPVFSKDAVQGRFGNITDKKKEAISAELSADTLIKYVAEYEEKVAQLEKIRKEVNEAKEAYDKGKQKIQSQVNDIKNSINSAGSYEEISKVSRKYGLQADSIVKPYKLFYSLQRIGIGRSFLDYSELTVKNVSLSGFHAEFNSRYYFAVAAGAVDYRFREFVFNNNLRPPQRIALIRFGKQTSQGNRLIFTAYKGQKALFPSNDSITRFSNTIYGFSVEGKWYLNKQNSITAEVAKSSFATNRYTGNSNTKSGIQLTDRSTSALFVSLHSFILKTGTKLRAQYRYQGGNFQSFTLFNMQNNFTAWSVLVDQSFWKNRFLLQAGLRKNEFTNSFIGIPYKSNVVFKSVQASFRKKRLPFITVAYMPSAQLSVIDDKVIENRFYTLMSSASHFYKIGSVRATSLAMYSRYYNSVADTGFVYFNAKNYYASQSLMVKKIAFNAAFSLSLSERDQLYTCEGGVQYEQNSFMIGATLKYNSLNSTVRRFGYAAQAGCQFPKIQCGLNVSFEHGFLPGFNHTLINNDFGRITVYKKF